MKNISPPPPYVVAVNLTRRCNLACAHCYLDAGERDHGIGQEMTTAEVQSVLGQIAALSPETMVVLTGGEPLLRFDLEQIARFGSDLGLMIVIGSNGLLLGEARANRLVEAGVRGIGISIDSLNPKTHDSFRGQQGAWIRAMNAIDACREAGLALQIHFTVTEATASEFENMAAFARSAGAIALNVFFLVCTGRGEKLSGITEATQEDVLRRVIMDARQSEGMMIRAKCAPHFKRLAHRFDPSWPITAMHGYEAGSCLAGTRYCRITPEGAVTPCPYMDIEAGSLRTETFQEIWNESPLFDALRQPKLEGRCGGCEYRILCGGCRARPLAVSGNLMGEDDLCAYAPVDGPVLRPPERKPSLPWSKDAEERMKRMPPFVRPLVRRKVEDYVLSKGLNLVTAQDIEALARQRFGSAMPPKDVAKRLARACLPQ